MLFDLAFSGCQAHSADEQATISIPSADGGVITADVYGAGGRQPKELIVLDGSAHAQFIYQPGQRARLLREVMRFLNAR